MPAGRQYVLCYGHDQILLETRKRILERAGYAVLSTSDQSTVEKELIGGNVSILVLCHTVTDINIATISSVLGQIKPPPAILCVTAGDDKHPFDNRQIKNVQGYDVQNGPAGFLAAVGKLRDSLGVAASVSSF